MRASVIWLTLVAASAATAALTWSIDRVLRAWTTPIKVAGVALPVPVPLALLMATTSLGGRLLHGRRVQRSIGTIEFRWDETYGRLNLICSPCRVGFPTVSKRPIEVESLRIGVQRFGDRLWGDIAVGQLRGYWRGTLGDDELLLSSALLQTPLAAVYDVLARNVADVARPHAEGHFSLVVAWRLPAGEITLEPRFDVDLVDGFGTDVLRGFAPRTPFGAAPFFIFSSPSSLPAVIPAKAGIQPLY